MIFFCDGTDIRELTLGLGAETDGIFAFSGGRERVSAEPDGFLRAIDTFLRSHDVSVGDVDGIVVVQGPGSSTALRASLALVNTIAFARAIPIYAIHADDVRGNTFALPLSVPAAFPEYAHGARITASNKDDLRRTIPSL